MVLDEKKMTLKGIGFLKDGKYDEALNCFETILIANPDNSDIWNKKGIALRSMGRYDEAIVCFNKSLELSPKDLDAS